MSVSLDVEERLAELIRIMCSEPDERKYRVMWEEFVALHEKRSPETVRRMERDQGLA